MQHPVLELDPLFEDLLDREGPAAALRFFPMAVYPHTRIRMSNCDQTNAAPIAGSTYL